jgi:hypothetical protein
MVESRSACCARPASRTFFSAFSISRTFLVALRVLTLAILAVCRSANAGSAALLRNFSSAAFLAYAAASRRSTKSGFKAIHVSRTYSIPGLASLHRFPSTHAPADNRAFTRVSVSTLCQSAGTHHTIDHVATNTAPPSTPPASSNQQPRQPQLLDCGGKSDGGLVTFIRKHRLT